MVVTPDKFILAIDLGTSGPKVALFSTQGEMIGSEFEETQLLLLPDGGAEQSPGEWWQAIEKAIRRLLGRSLVPNDEIIAIAFTAQWSGTVPVDEAGNALSNAIIWMDSRGAPYIQQIVNGPLKIQGYGLGKLFRWIQLTGGIPANAGKDPIAHILYIKHVHPEIYERTHKFLEPVDYLGARLTGCMAASFDSITLHWLTDNRNIQDIGYAEQLVKLSGIDRTKLPDLKPANSILGTLRPEIAREWGVRADVQVVIGSPDIHSAAIGSGAVRDYETHLYIGTSSWLTCHVPFKKTDLLHNLAALPSAIPGRYVLTDEQECAGVCLQFLRDNILFHQDELTSGAKPDNVYQLFDQIAARVPAGSHKVIFMPWLYGERSPVDDRFIRGGFFNQSLQTSRADMVRAIFEGVAYNSRWLLKYVEQFIKRRVEAINMVGGGARSDIWCQIHADILNRPIRQVEDPVQVNVRGAALLASVALGTLRHEDIASRVPIARTYMPNPAHRKIYDELFEEFIAIYESNRRIYARLNRSQHDHEAAT
ncbi:MAG TPA: FGGY-family carbohydrate kinase [Anaerolineales bacterium]|nr:FGGY-family carbohydrate kinase [Anaerolineales bacterium]